MTNLHMSELTQVRILELTGDAPHDAVFLELRDSDGNTVSVSLGKPSEYRDDVLLNSLIRGTRHDRGVWQYIGGRGVEASRQWDDMLREIVPKDDLKDVTVSEGTLRSYDLVDASLRFLQQSLFTERAAAWIRSEIPCTELEDPLRDEDDDFWDDDFYMDRIMGMIDQVMLRLAPPGYYYGAHPGNSSLFGFWKKEEQDDDDDDDA